MASGSRSRSPGSDRGYKHRGNHEKEKSNRREKEKARDRYQKYARRSRSQERRRSQSRDRSMRERSRRSRSGSWSRSWSNQRSSYQRSTYQRSNYPVVEERYNRKKEKERGDRYRYGREYSSSDDERQSWDRHRGREERYRNRGRSKDRYGARNRMEIINRMHLETERRYKKFSPVRSRSSHTTDYRRWKTEKKSRRDSYTSDSSSDSTSETSSEGGPPKKKESKDRGGSSDDDIEIKKKCKDDSSSTSSSSSSSSTSSSSSSSSSSDEETLKTTDKHEKNDDYVRFSKKSVEKSKAVEMNVKQDKEEKSFAKKSLKSKVSTNSNSENPEHGKGYHKLLKKKVINVSRGSKSDSDDNADKSNSQQISEVKVINESSSSDSEHLEPEKVSHTLLEKEMDVHSEATKVEVSQLEKVSEQMVMKKDDESLKTNAREKMPARALSKISEEKEAAESSDADSENLDCEKIVSKLQDEKLFDRSDIDIEESDPLKVSPTLSERKEDESSDNCSEDSSLGKASYEMAMKKTGKSLSTKAEAYEPGNASLEMTEKKADESLDSICKDSDSFKGSEDYVQILEESSEFISEKNSPNQTLNEKDKETGEITDSDDSESEENPHENLTETNANDNAELDSEDQDQRAGEMSNDEKSEGKEPSSELQFERDLEQEKLDQEVQTNLTEVSSCDPNDSQIVSRSDKESEEATEESLDGNQDGLVSIGNTSKNSESVRDVELCTVVEVDLNSERKETASQNEDESVPQENLESDAKLRYSEEAKTSCEKITEMSDSGEMPVDLGKSELKTTKGDEPSDHKRGKKHKKHKAKRSSSSSEGDEDSKKNDMQVVYNSESDETSEQELLRKKKQLEEQLQIEEEIRQRSKSQETERDNAHSKKLVALNNTDGNQENSSQMHSKKSSSKDNTSRSRSRSHSQSRHDSKIEDRKNKKNNDKSGRSDKRLRYHSSGDDDDDSAVQQESEEPQIGGQYWEADHSKDTPRHQKGKQPKTSDTYWNKYADKLGIQIEDPKSKGQGTDRGRDRDRNDEKRREMWSNSGERRHRAGSDESEGKNFKRRKDEQNDIVGQKNESKEPELRAKELIKKPVIDPLSTKTGGAYIPPAKLKMMQAEITDKSSPAFQRLAWEALKKSINGLVNKVNVSNIGIIVRELLKENIVRGRGVLCRALMQAQSFSPTFTHVYAAMVAIINTKFPQIGELLLKRLVIQLRRGVKRNDKNVCVSSCRFIAHLINQQVAHEVVALEILTFLLERAKDVTDDSEVAEKSRNNSCELAITFLTECGMKLNEVSPRGMTIILETLRNVLHEGKLEQRVAYMLEVIFATVKDGFKNHPSVIEELDLVEEDDQFTHIVELDGKLDAQDILNVFRHDPEYEDNEEKYKEIRAGILGDESDESGSEAGSESGSESDDEESEDENEKQDSQTILDQTETNMVAFRRTVYLTIQSSLDVDECAHKLLKGEIKPGWEAELCNMILDCCAQQRTYIKFYGLLAQRFCMINKAYQEPFQQIFQDAYDTCHRLETEKLRNVARLFAHLLFSDAISWEVLSHVHLNEDETTSSSRVFIKILFQELAEFMSLAKLNERLRDPTLAPAFEGLLPRDNPCNTRFAINFFTSCGLGGLTDDLREFLRTQPKPTAVVAPVQQQINKNDGNKSNTDTSSDTSSDSDSSSSSSSSTSSTSSSSSSSSSESTSESTGDTSDSSQSDSEDSSGSEDEKRRKKKWKREAKRKSTASKNKSRNVRKSERSREIKGTNKDKSDSEEKEVSDDQKERERRDRWRSIHTDERSRRRRDDSSESGERENDRYEWDERRRGYTYTRGDRREVENAEKRERHEGVYDVEERRRLSDDRARIDLRKVEEEETGYLRRREEKKEQKRRYNSGDDSERHQRRNDSGDRGEKRKKRHDSRERDSKRKRSEFEDRAKDDDKGVEHWKQDFNYQRGEYGRQNEVRDHQEWKEQIKEVRDGEWRKDKKIYGHRSESGSDGRRGWERHHFH